MKPTQQQGKLKKQFINSAIIITSMEYREVKCRIFARRAMVDQAREGLCCQRINLTFLICLT